MRAIALATVRIHAQAAAQVAMEHAQEHALAHAPEHALVDAHLVVAFHQEWEDNQYERISSFNQ